MVDHYHGHHDPSIPQYGMGGMGMGMGAPPQMSYGMAHHQQQDVGHGHDVHANEQFTAMNTSSSEGASHHDDEENEDEDDDDEDDDDEDRPSKRSRTIESGGDYYAANGVGFTSGPGTLASTLSGLAGLPPSMIGPQGQMMMMKMKKKKMKGKGGSSCHQCKSRRNFTALTYCTANLDKKNKKCRKKFCGHCLKKFYKETAVPSDRNNWKCPSCRKICCCAACRRHGGGAPPVPPSPPRSSMPTPSSSHVSAIHPPMPPSSHVVTTLTHSSTPLATRRGTSSSSAGPPPPPPTPTSSSSHASTSNLPVLTTLRPISSSASHRVTALTAATPDVHASPRFPSSSNDDRDITLPPMPNIHMPANGMLSPMSTPLHAPSHFGEFTPAELRLRGDDDEKNSDINDLGPLPSSASAPSSSSMAGGMSMGSMLSSGDAHGARDLSSLTAASSARLGLALDTPLTFPSPAISALPITPVKRQQIVSQIKDAAKGAQEGGNQFAQLYGISQTPNMKKRIQNILAQTDISQGQKVLLIAELLRPYSGNKVQ